jgi:hypothetical protein
LIAADGTPKPALETFTAAAQDLDPRNPVLPDDAELARVPALELAYYVPAGAPVEVRTAGGDTFSVPLGADGWIEVPLDGAESVVALRASDAHGHAVDRTVRLGTASVEFD